MTNALDFETMQQIEALSKELGDVECRRLGFIFKDEQGVIRLTVAGMGYLIHVKAMDVKTLAEAFAAGYQCAHEEKA